MKCIGQVTGGFKSVTFLNVKSPNLRAKSNLLVFSWSADGKLGTKNLVINTKAPLCLLSKPALFCLPMLFQGQKTGLSYYPQLTSRDWLSM